MISTDNIADPECFMGHRAHKMTLIITLSLFLTILLLIYIAYIWIFVSAASQRKRIYEQQWSRCSLANAAPQSKVDIQNSNQGTIIDPKNQLFSNRNNIDISQSNTYIPTVYLPISIVSFCIIQDCICLMKQDCHLQSGVLQFKHAATLDIFSIKLYVLVNATCFTP